MGTGEESTPVKPSKPSSSAQETPVTPSYPDWSSSMQAYYGAGAAPPFFASTVASPTPHPYLWPNQHPLMPPYGTPVPYPALYPAGGIYAHPNMATAAVTTQGNVESEAAKSSEGKDRASNKRSRGASATPGLVVAKIAESGKAASGSGNDGATQSAESGSEGSSEGTDENNHEHSGNKKGSFDQMLADAQNSTAVSNFQNSVPGNPVVSMPATNLNIGMDLWNPSSAAPGAMKMRPNHGVSSAVPLAMMNDQWIQDERELKRQKRKQSNRESARRSRLRKQAECEELQQRVEALSNENRTLRDELQRLSEECEKLTSENNTIKEELTRLCGPETVSKLENDSVTPQQQQQSHVTAVDWKKKKKKKVDWMAKDVENWQNKNTNRYTNIAITSMSEEISAPAATAAATSSSTISVKKKSLWPSILRWIPTSNDHIIASEKRLLSLVKY